jgi:hypothetical protein
MESIEVRGKDHALYVGPNVSVDDIVDLGVLGGLDPSDIGGIQDSMEGHQSGFEKGAGYNYVEYSAKYGRIRVYTELDEVAGIVQWCEFLPTDLPVDRFFTHEIAAMLDIGLSDCTIWIYRNRKSERPHVSVQVKGRRIDRIAWMGN